MAEMIAYDKDLRINDILPQGYGFASGMPPQAGLD